MTAASRILTFGRVSVETDTGPLLMSGRVADLLLLLLEASESWVSRDALIDRLWADRDQPPPSARNALRTYVAKLRDNLGESALLTRTSPCAYRLDRTVVRSDLDDVRDALRVARLRLPSDPVGALQVLEAARQFVVGDPLGGIDNPWLIATRMSTEELMDDLDDEYCTALVKAGVSVEHLEEISRLAEYRPLRERRTEMRMRALRQAGRRREALRVAAAHHQRMVDQTGLSASAEIRLLEQELLVEDNHEPIIAHLIGVDDLIAAIAAEPFVTQPEPLARVLGISQGELSELVGMARSRRLIEGDFGSFARLGADPFPDGVGSRWHQRWSDVDGLPVWRVLDHRIASGEVDNQHCSAVIAAGRLACDAGELRAAFVLLDRFHQATRNEDRFGRGVDRRSHVDLLNALAAVLDQLGRSDDAVDKRAQAVDIALTEDWVDLAATVAAPDSAIGRSYVENEDVTRLIRRTMRRLDSAERSAHTVRLLSELLCRTVLDAGLTPELEPIHDRLLAMRSVLSSPIDQAHAYRARLYVAVSRGETVDQSALDEMLSLCRRLELHDHVSDLLVVTARNALERGDGAAWKRSVEAVSDLAALTHRPVDVWTRVALRATDLQLRGQHQAAAAQADDAQLLGERWSIADSSIATESFAVAAAWQRAQFGGEDTPRLASTSVVGFARQILARSYRGDLAPDDSLLDVMVRSCVRDSQPSERALESLPALLIATQAAWNVQYSQNWDRVAAALDAWPVAGSVLGMIPVATFGPVDRFRALAAIRLGQLDRARLHFGEALIWCDAMRANGWAAVTLEDQAYLEDLAGTGRASAVRAEAAYLRRSRRLRQGRPAGWLSTSNGSPGA